MYEPLTKAIEALGPWPIVQATVAVLIVFGIIKAMNRGEKDRKTNGEATPRWFANEQSLELLREIKKMLHEVKHESRQQTQLLEQIANENVINPRRLRE